MHEDIFRPLEMNQRMAGLCFEELIKRHIISGLK